jgi:hypothetical protein
MCAYMQFIGSYFYRESAINKCACGQSFSTAEARSVSHYSLESLGTNVFELSICIQVQVQGGQLPSGRRRSSSSARRST